MPTLAGYVVTWGDQAPVDGCWETFAPMAFIEPFTASLRFAHREGAYAAFARTCTGQLRLRQDQVGLAFEADCGITPEWRGLIQNNPGRLPRHVLRVPLPRSAAYGRSRHGHEGQVG